MDFKHTLLLGIGGLLCLSARAQVLGFEKTFGGNEQENGLSLLETNDHGLLLTGWTETNTSGLADYFIVKTDSLGNELWSLTHGGFNNDIPVDAIELDDGSIVIVGFTGSFTSSPSRDVYLVKLDAGGNIVWTKSIGGNQRDEGTSIRQTSDGGFIVSALTESFGAGDRDAWLIKTNSTGDTLWTKTFGGAEFDDAWDVEITADGGYILTGGTYSFANGSEDDMWLIKTDSMGNLEWMNMYGEANRMDWGWEVVSLADGYAAVGLYNADPQLQNHLTGDAFFIKTDLQGNMLWNKTITTDDRSEATGISATSDSGFVLCGFEVRASSSTPSLFWVRGMDAEGEELWVQELGESNSLSRAEHVIQLSNGDYAATGYTGLTQTTMSDLYLAYIVDTTGAQDTTGANGITLTGGNAEQLLRMYPNPSPGSVWLAWDREELPVSAFHVRSMSGQVMEKIPAQRAHGMQEIQMQHPGVYLVEARDGDGVTIATKRLLIAR